MISSIYNLFESHILFFLLKSVAAFLNYKLCDLLATTHSKWGPQAFATLDPTLTIAFPYIDIFQRYVCLFACLFGSDGTLTKALLYSSEFMYIIWRK